MEQAYVVDYVRSPFTPASRGALAGVRPDDLAAGVVAGLVERSGIDPAAFEDLRALALVDAYVPPVPGEIVLSGSAGHGALVNAIAGEVLAGRVKPDHSVVLEALASVLTGGDRCHLRSVEEQEVLSLERATATSLLGTGGTVDRIRHVLAGRGAA